MGPIVKNFLKGCGYTVLLLCGVALVLLVLFILIKLLMWSWWVLLVYIVLIGGGVYVWGVHMDETEAKRKADEADLLAKIRASRPVPYGGSGGRKT